MVLIQQYFELMIIFLSLKSDAMSWLRDKFVVDALHAILFLSFDDALTQSSAVPFKEANAA